MSLPKKGAWDLPLEKPRWWKILEINVAYPQKDLGKTVLSSVDSQVRLSLLSKTDNNRTTNRLMGCQRRQQSSSQPPDRAPTWGPPRSLAGLSAGPRWPVAGCLLGWRLSLPCHCGSLQLVHPESPFFFEQMKINQIASSPGDGLAHSVRWKRA